MFLMQYFCLHGVLPFSKPYPEIESTWPTAKCRKRKSFSTWYYILTYATLPVSFSSNLKAINVFSKHILKSKSRDQSIQPRKKLFCPVIVKIICATFRESFWSKSKASGGAKSKNKHPNWLYCSMVEL